MEEFCDPAMPGVVSLPSGRLVRGRSLRHPMPGGLRPALGVYLPGERTRRPVGVPLAALAGLRPPRRPRARHPHARRGVGRAAVERVEVACAGGRGRTGTALACLAIMDGAPGSEAIT